ncbi:hypothetical protein MASR1M90_15690 [Desulfovibrionales bacterium]
MSFAYFFKAITNNPPFPWQERLFHEFAHGKIPETANIPTGLGKTSVVAIWLIALAMHPDKTPRRLVYVVNRRTVVDQTTTEVEKLRQALVEKEELKEIQAKLKQLCTLPLPVSTASPLAISTLRGQFADNYEWSADLTRPAVIVGTVDMVGSGLLFSRYTVGFKLRPHHAAFLAQDALLVHDEAHLEPAFQKLLNSIVMEQLASNDPRKLKVMELSATTRSDSLAQPFGITEEDEKNSFIIKRIYAAKRLSLLTLQEGEKEQEKIVELALSWKDKKRAVLIFVRSVEDATRIADGIGGETVERVLTLTGTMRGKERDELVKHPLFERFLPDKKQDSSETDTVWLVATSAGEVGVNFSADEMICDLSTYESMAQRLGRLNRFGECTDSTVVVVCPAIIGKKNKQGKITQDEMDSARERTLALLQQLGNTASPAALNSLSIDECLAAFSPLPQMLTASAIQYDVWSLTSIRESIAARPPVAPYLHGKAEWQPAETHIAWRDDPEIIQGPLLDAYLPESLLEDFPLKPHEILRDTTERIAKTLCARIKAYFGKEEGATNNQHKTLPPAWLINKYGECSVYHLISSDDLLAAYRSHNPNHREKYLLKNHESALKDDLADATIILPSCLAGISKQGLFISDVKDGSLSDVADIPNVRLRLQASSPELPAEYAAQYRLVRVIDTRLHEEDEKESSKRYWLWFEAKDTVYSENRFSAQPETLAAHTESVLANIAAITEKLFPAVPVVGEPDLRRCCRIAAKLHDDGKDRRLWQMGIGNTHYDPGNPATILAKSGGNMRRRNSDQKYRHEFGSLAIAASDPLGQDMLAELSELERDIVLHLIAAHHGRARPYFPSEEVFDYNYSPDASMDLAAEVPYRFGRLQQKFGRWGLAWMESILRSADYAASAGIVADKEKLSALPKYISMPATTEKKKSSKVPVISLRVDIVNPGHYFACCGLFELADKIMPGILAHFEQNRDAGSCSFVLQSDPYEKEGVPFTLESLLKKFALAELTTADTKSDFENDTNELNDDNDYFETEAKEEKAPSLQLGTPFDLRLDWWEAARKDTSALKVWAGSMNCLRIACAMKNAVSQIVAQPNFMGNAEDLLFDSRVVYEISSMSKKKPKKVEPFYFDAVRGPNSESRDVGFSSNSLKFETLAAPAVEILCLIGLQRATPAPDARPRQFVYHTWTQPLPITLLAAAINGLLPGQHQAYRFESWFRTSQKKHKAFLPAQLIAQQ